MGDWAVKWQMKFNVEKCKVVHYGKRCIDAENSLYGQPLEEVASEKDLGVVFSNDLTVRTDMDMGQLFETQPNPPKYKPNPTHNMLYTNPTQPISIYP